MRKECTLVLFDDDGNVIPNNIAESPNDVIDSKNDVIESSEPQSDDLIIKGAKGIKDGLYNITDGKLFQYKAKGGTVRTYKISSANQVTSKLESVEIPTVADEESTTGQPKNKLDLISRADPSAELPLANLKQEFESADAVQGGRYENAMQKLREMPRYLNGVKAKQIKKISADRPPGEWIFDTDISIGGGRTSAGYVCSNCRKDYFRVDGFNFCPNCGAKMTPYKGGDSE